MSLIKNHPRRTWRGLWYTRRMLTVSQPAKVWQNQYRDEVTRHGGVEFETYPASETVDETFEGGIWSRLADRQAGS
jgi:hypothetical protein